MQKDRQFRVSGDWALASDGMQWMIQRRKGDGDVWVSIKFIHSTKEWLAYRLRQLAPSADADRLLEGLPDTFDEWLKSHSRVGHNASEAGETHQSQQILHEPIPLSFVAFR
jgi:hypothetical protein